MEKEFIDGLTVNFRVVDNIYKIILGDVYEGEFKSCLKHGEGKEFF